MLRRFACALAVLATGLAAIGTDAHALDIDGNYGDDFVMRTEWASWIEMSSKTGLIRNHARLGSTADIPVPGYYDRSRGWPSMSPDLAVWRPSDGTWHIRSRDTDFRQSRQFGLPGDIPVPYDYSGSSYTDIAVWRPSTGNWHILDGSGRQRVTQWGLPGDVPVPGDYDGDRAADYAVWRPDNGTWYIRNARTGATRVQQWGLRGDVPVPSDYDRDGTIDLAVWRPSDGTWHIMRSSDGWIDVRQHGLPGDVPAPGDFDGDAKTDPTVYRPSTLTWYVLQSSTHSLRTVTFAQHPGRPVAFRRGRYVELN